MLSAPWLGWGLLRLCFIFRFMQLIGIVPSDASILQRLGEMYDAEGDKSQAFQYHYDVSKLPPFEYWCMFSYYLSGPLLLSRNNHLSWLQQNFASQPSISHIHFAVLPVQSIQHLCDRVAGCLLHRLTVLWKGHTVLWSCSHYTVSGKVKNNSIIISRKLQL